MFPDEYLYMVDIESDKVQTGHVPSKDGLPLPAILKPEQIVTPLQPTVSPQQEPNILGGIGRPGRGRAAW